MFGMMGATARKNLDGLANLAAALSDPEQLQRSIAEIRAATDAHHAAVERGKAELEAERAALAVEREQLAAERQAFLDEKAAHRRLLDEIVR